MYIKSPVLNIFRCVEIQNPPIHIECYHYLWLCFANITWVEVIFLTVSQSNTSNVCRLLKIAAKNTHGARAIIKVIDDKSDNLVAIL